MVCSQSHRALSIRNTFVVILVAVAVIAAAAAENDVTPARQRRSHGHEDGTAMSSERIWSANNVEVNRLSENQAHFSSTVNDGSILEKEVPNEPCSHSSTVIFIQGIF